MILSLAVSLSCLASTLAEQGLLRVDVTLRETEIRIEVVFDCLFSPGPHADHSLSHTLYSRYCRVYMLSVCETMRDPSEPALPAAHTLNLKANWIHSLSTYRAMNTLLRVSLFLRQGSALL